MVGGGGRGGQSSFRGELEFPADVGSAARAVVVWPQVEAVSCHWFSPFFSSSLIRSSGACSGGSWLSLI